MEGGGGGVAVCVRHMGVWQCVCCGGSGSVCLVRWCGECGNACVCVVRWCGECGGVCLSAVQADTHVCRVSGCDSELSLL